MSARNVAIGTGIGALAAYFLFFNRKSEGSSSGAPPVKSDATCKTLLSPNHGGKRSLSSIQWVVLHDTEGGMDALSVAQWFANPAAKVSAHLVVDDFDTCYRCVPDDVIAWAAPGANDTGLHIEMTAPAGAAMKWTTDQWREHPSLLVLAAQRVAEWCLAYDLPMAFIDAAGLKAGRKGITTHFEVTKAFSGGMGHFDPGTNFPLSEFVEIVKAQALPMSVPEYDV